MQKCCFVFLGLIAMMFTGCATGPRAPFTPSQACFLSNTTAPLSTEFNATPVASLRSGSASAMNILGLFALGNCGIKEAAEDGKLTTVEFADYTNFNVLGIYQRTTVTVYGK